MANSIVFLGSCMIDFVSYTKRLPKPGETVIGNRFDTNFGGKGANQCVAARKLGGNVTVVARVGDDLWGDRYLGNFVGLGVNAKHVRKTEGCPNGIAQIAVSSDTGENQIVIVPGANARMTADDVRRAQAEIENAEVVVCQLETPVECAVEAIRLTKKISILNGAPALSEYQKELITSPTIFCVNETEAEIFSGMPVKTTDDAKDVLRHFLTVGCKSVIITLGSGGALYGSRERPSPVHVRAKKVEAVDTTGAGDAFVGALAFFLANYKGVEVSDAIRASCVVASDSCTRPGTQASFPDSSILNECFL